MCEFNGSPQHPMLFEKIECLRWKDRTRAFYTDNQKSEMWDRWQRGESLSSIGRRFDRASSSIFPHLARTAGINPRAWAKANCPKAWKLWFDKALIIQACKMPTKFHRSMTWDRGWEMTDHAKFSIATKVDVHFCDPQSTWQRGTNENTNRLLRQYFPRGMDTSTNSQARLSAVARQLAATI